MGAGASAEHTRPTPRRPNRSEQLDDAVVQDAVKRMRRAQRKRRASALLLGGQPLAQPSLLEEDDEPLCDRRGDTQGG